MKIVTKKVFYCDWCKKHGLSRPAMEQHERHCTLNPDRTCRWKSEAWTHDVDTTAAVVEIKSRDKLVKADISWLRDLTNGCPACMLAVLRQSGLEYHYDYHGHGKLFEYEEEVRSFRVKEREAWHRAEQESELAALYGTWL